MSVHLLSFSPLFRFHANRRAKNAEGLGTMLSHAQTRRSTAVIFVHKISSFWRRLIYSHSIDRCIIQRRTLKFFIRHRTLCQPDIMSVTVRNKVSKGIPPPYYRLGNFHVGIICVKKFCGVRFLQFHLIHKIFP